MTTAQDKDRIKKAPTAEIVRELQNRGYRLSETLLRKKPIVFLARVMGYIKWGTK